ncbi:MAG: NAD(P)H-hydrate dehydratase, partial [Methanosarcinales archaeon]|nr:NAD(P)H-hydrate dehydratase [Methanosarcinales archaeon]
MKPISAEEMNALDANCAYLGLLPLQLMENAGAALAREIRSLARGRRLAIVAGRGNNGGDAFAAVRHLQGFEVTVFLLGRAGEIGTEEARQNWKILEALEYDLREVRDAGELEELSKYDLIVDAVLGTGVRGTVRGLARGAIQAMNSSGRPILSVDVQSGMGTDLSANADLTVTFHRPKDGMSGQIKVADIGIPEEAEFMVGPGDLRLVGRRAAESHKGDSGRILVIGGGAYTGAPALTASAALRAGADIVTVATPENVAHTISGFSPNLIVRRLKGDHLSPDNLDRVKELILSHDVVVMGMGLGRNPETNDALAEIMPLCQKTVIDADALLPDLPLKGIVTPHAGEFRRISEIELLPGRGRRDIVKQFAASRGLVVLLKGKMDLISDGETVKGNTTGNPGMTVGGTGDVLAGVT